jgi:Replication protein C (RepC)
MNQRRAELQRLCEVTVWTLREDGVELQSRLLAWEARNNQGVTMLLNWRLTDVLFGGQFSPVGLTERLSLHSECARALHCALSMRIRPGMTMASHLDKLSGYIWADGNSRLWRSGRLQPAGCGGSAPPT